MAQLVDELKSLVQYKEVNDDNIVFKLFTRVSFAICILSSVVVMATQYFGDPIHCDKGLHNINSDVFKSYCWIHGSKHVPKEYQTEFGCISNQVSNQFVNCECARLSLCKNVFI